MNPRVADAKWQHSPAGGKVGLATIMDSRVKVARLVTIYGLGYLIMVFLEVK